MTFRAAVVGCGRIGSEYADDPRVTGIYSHAGAYAASARATLVGVCDADSLRAARAASRWGLSTGHTELARMLADTRPEVVSICTPDPTHASVLREVLAYPGIRAVLAEKPLALETDEAASLVDLAQSRGVKLAVNYLRRHASGHQWAREHIANGGIGRVQCVVGLYTGGLVHNGSHWLDHVRWLVGEISGIEAFPVSGDTTHSPDLRLEFVGGARGVLHGCDASSFAVFETDIVGTAGRVRITELGHRIEVFESGESPYYSGYRNLLSREVRSGGLEHAMVGAVEDLLACIDTAREPRCNGRDGLLALRWARHGQSQAAGRG